MPTRRDFLATSSLLGFGATVPAFLGRTAVAAPNAAEPGAKDTVLVVVQLTGGNDGLNTVVPYADDGYGRLRTALRLPENSLKKVDDHIGLHPSLSGFAELLEDGSLSIVQGIGYPNPDESHFRSMDIWQAGSLAEQLTEGWLGKTLVHMPASPAFHVAATNEPSGLALAGAPAKVPSISNLEQFQLQTLAANSADRDRQRKFIAAGAKLDLKAGQVAGQSDLLSFVQQTAVNTFESSERLREIAKNYQPKSPYPATLLGERLKLTAQLIEADLGSRVFYVTLDGFDTHAGQLVVHANLLMELSDAMTAFFKDMDARGHRDRILMMTFSEFGRRAKENLSAGTDHGSAAPMFLVGGRVKPGLIGDHPSLSDLLMDKLKHHTDFRQVYATILDQWLEVPSAKILGAEFKAIDCLKA